MHTIVPGSKRTPSPACFRPQWNTFLVVGGRHAIKCQCSAAQCCFRRTTTGQTTAVRSVGVVVGRYSNHAQWKDARDGQAGSCWGSAGPCKGVAFEGGARRASGSGGAAYPNQGSGACARGVRARACAQRARVKNVARSGGLPAKSLYAASCGVWCVTLRGVGRSLGVPKRAARPSNAVP